MALTRPGLALPETIRRTVIGHPFRRRPESMLAHARLRLRADHPRPSHRLGVGPRSRKSSVGCRKSSRSQAGLPGGSPPDPPASKPPPLESTGFDKCLVHAVYPSATGETSTHGPALQSPVQRRRPKGRMALDGQHRRLYGWIAQAANTAAPSRFGVHNAHRRRHHAHRSYVRGGTRNRQSPTPTGRNHEHPLWNRPGGRRIQRRGRQPASAGGHPHRPRHRRHARRGVLAARATVRTWRFRAL